MEVPSDMSRTRNFNRSDEEINIISDEEDMERIYQQMLISEPRSRRLHHIHNQIAGGLNSARPSKRSIMVALLDLSKAFDTVSHDTLLSDILLLL